MSNLDYFLAFLLLGYVWVGFSTGLIHSVGSLLGVIVAALGASRWFATLTPWVEPLVGSNTLAAAIISFVVLFLLINRGIGVILMLVDRVFNIVAVVPGMKILNRLGGAFFGFLEGAFAIGITLHFISRLPANGTVAGAFEHSRLVPRFLDISAWLVALLPEVLQNARSILQK